MKYPHPPLDMILARLKYNPRTGLLRRKINVGKGLIGSVAGTLSPDGYVRVGVMYKMYLAHRLIWYMQTGAWPKHEVDHRNGNRADNRWRNLREATREQNIANSPARTTNKIGIKGVRWHVAGGAWQARMFLNGKDMHLGLFDTPEQAGAAYVKAAKKHFGEFARVR